MRAPYDNHRAQETSVAVRLVRVVLVMVGVVAAVVAATASGAISLPELGTGSDAQASSRVGLAAQREAADRQWATATCTNILDWKNEIHRDETSLGPSVDPSARIKDAAAATGRLLNELDQLGPPPTADSAQARAATERLRSEVESRLHAIQGAASSVASGNLLAIGRLVSELANDTVLSAHIAGELRHVLSVDLGLSLAESATCRQLVGIPL